MPIASDKPLLTMNMHENTTLSAHARVVSNGAAIIRFATAMFSRFKHRSVYGLCPHINGSGGKEAMFIQAHKAKNTHTQFGYQYQYLR